MTIDAEQIKAQTFSIEAPELIHSKTSLRLAKTDLVRAVVQYVKEGGENELHAHSGNDGFWLVLAGEFAFYGEDGLIAKLGPKQGICTPRGFKYWFESSSDEVGEILHVASSDPRVEDRRLFGAPTKDTGGGTDARTV